MNFSHSFVRKGALVLALALVVGCGGSKDGNREYAQGSAAYAARDLSKADRLLTESLSAAPDNVDRLVALARVKLDLGDLAAAQGLVTKAMLNADGDSDVALLSAQVAWHAKDYKAAARIFTETANDMKQTASVRSQALAGLGVVEMARDGYHLARIAFLRAIQLDRRNASAWYHLGLIYQEFGYLESALEQFEIFARLDAQAGPRVQKVQKAIIPAIKDSIARAAAERPGAANRNSAACATALARAEKNLRDKLPKSARKAYQDALNADPLSYPAALGLARSWERIDKTKDGQMKALSFYRQACALRPSAVTTFLTAGALALRLGQAAQAVEIYSRAVAASPTSLEALDGLIQSLRRVGNKASIAQAYQLYRDSLAGKKR